MRSTLIALTNNKTHTHTQPRFWLWLWVPSLLSIRNGWELRRGFRTSKLVRAEWPSSLRSSDKMKAPSSTKTSFSSFSSFSSFFLSFFLSSCFSTVFTIVRRPWRLKWRLASNSTIYRKVLSWNDLGRSWKWEGTRVYTWSDLACACVRFSQRSSSHSLFSLTCHPSKLNRNSLCLAFAISSSTTNNYLLNEIWFWSESSLAVLIYSVTK